MSKIMVVEDDASLREIYGIRIAAEGYEIVSAGDGEEALAVAVREKPDLILSDVMMPKISGFDMLDILRSTPETANIKVIMMTALSGEDQRQRGERLGADRYLVKSQVGIEDVVNAIHEVLSDRSVATPAAPETPATPEMPDAPASRLEQLVAEQPAMPPEIPTQSVEQPQYQMPTESAPVPQSEAMQPEVPQPETMQPATPEMSQPMPATAPVEPQAYDGPAPENPAQ